ncbi:SigB/SigF/SigG family RNA polymerase sigma factor [Coriobacteriales bacterium OH1046]|nr:SigB/SigF/SigG family RNA polymerase sigma factor [Coriobacteriales bacterium OH1046]
MPSYPDDEYVEFADEDDADERDLLDRDGVDDPDEGSEEPDDAASGTVSRPAKWNRLRTRRLFRAFHAGDAAARQELIMAYDGLARYLARKFKNRGESDEDLEQVAYLGLIKAIDRFEPERGLEFSTYATPTIMGELRRHFRDKGWSVRVPRRLQELSQKINRATDDLAVALGHMPSVPEIAGHLGVSVDEVLEAMESSSAYSAVSFDTGSGTDDEDAPALIDHLGDEDKDLAGIDDRLLLEETISEFSPREQQIVRMRFIEGLTQVEIAQQLDISQVQVSRLLRKTLRRLQERIDPESLVF